MVLIQAAQGRSEAIYNFQRIFSFFRRTKCTQKRLLGISLASTRRTQKQDRRWSRAPTSGYLRPAAVRNFAGTPIRDIDYNIISIGARLLWVLRNGSFNIKIKTMLPFFGVRLFCFAAAARHKYCPLLSSWHAQTINRSLMMEYHHLASSSSTKAYYL